MYEVVLQDGAGRKVVAHVHECGQGSGGEALDPLHGGGGRVGAERVQAAMLGPRARRLVQHGQLVLVGPRRRVARLVAGEIYAERVHHEQHGAAVARPAAAEVVPRRPWSLGRQRVAARAGAVHLKPHEQEAAHEQVDAHGEEGAQPCQEAEHPKPLHGPRLT